MNNDLSIVIQALRDGGLDYRGAFHPTGEDVVNDGVPGCGFADGPGTLMLVGNIGGAMWPAFAAGRRDEPDALDNWTKRVLGGIVGNFDREYGGVVALYPSDGPPYLPFQRWAMRGDNVYPSPLGLLIHPVHGLWHGYRGALVFRKKLELKAVDNHSNPCETCVGQPCLSSCPVDAFTPGSYDVKACARHLTTAKGDGCLKYGCLARGACPVGPRRPYPEAQTRFHMEIFRDTYA